MADKRELGNRKPARRRNPWAIVGLMIITLGIYGAFWWYFVNRELRDYGFSKGDRDLGTSDPSMSVLAVTLGGFIIIPPFVSYWGGMKRLRQAQSLAGVPLSRGGLFALMFVSGLLLLLPLLGAFAYYQSGLNRVLDGQTRVGADGPPQPIIASPERVGATSGLAS